MLTSEEVVWVFVGEGAQFPCAVFSSRESGKRWISSQRLSGSLTAYPVDEAVFDWAIRNGIFTPAKDRHRSPSFIQRFSSASQEHYHFQAGTCPDLPPDGGEPPASA